jgi:hypothetical protein
LETDGSSDWIELPILLILIENTEPAGHGQIQ